MSFNYTTTRELRENLHLCAATCNKKFNVITAADKIYAGNISAVTNVTNILFQSPTIFEKMIGKLELNFTNIEHSNMFIPDFYWKSDIAYFRWFHQLAELPALLFLLKDTDQKFYVLMGQMLAEKTIELNSPADLGANWGDLDTEQHQEITDKIVQNCITLIKCGERHCFKTEKYIQHLLREFKVALNYDELYDRYCAENAQRFGIKFKKVA